MFVEIFNNKPSLRFFCLIGIHKDKTKLKPTKWEDLFIIVTQIVSGHDVSAIAQTVELAA